MQIDLNCDMGEGFGAYRVGMDEEVIKHITSANIACGWHAGDAMVMERTVRLAKEHGVGVGAHPGYPDLLGFGRRNMDCLPEEIRNYVVYQVGALRAFCDVHATRLCHVKAHGSLYNMAWENEWIARALGEAILSLDPGLVCVALAGAKAELMGRIGRELGLKVVYEAFPDRAYTPQGTLVSRRTAGAVIKDPDTVAERALMMARDGKVVAVDGTEIPLRVQTLCVHGDTPGAVNLVRRIRGLLEMNGIEVRPMAVAGGHIS